MPQLTGSERAMKRLGFGFEVGGVHLARTMMVDDLKLTLLASEKRSAEDYAFAIEEENILGKPSAQSRKLAFRHLRKLYGLDPSLMLFRSFSFFYAREDQSPQLLCLLIAYARDAVLRLSAPFILDMKEGEPFNRGTLEAYIEGLYPGRFSEATLKSTAQNLAGTWTQSGHLVGRVKKIRSPVIATPAAVSFALLLAFLRGGRGELLFESEYVKLLDCSAGEATRLAEAAARSGLITLKRVGSVIEVTFPRLLNAEEMELLREQS
ncbi:hypothetical protein [Botrimarina hoheduenensis]|uniref:Inner membrane protein (DUF1819) n=1 Tax=Botrimarina hoheduenensis TaxID=2528000 RepID=A0A5C5WFS6_9BACT|nr:hypothetical protein [Botrimarina hoheduenensis]TWT48945.1 hypothetical protein Pla111_07230 [Botrimarina hoheduenensis]